MAANDFFSFELDVQVPKDAIKVGHSVNANVYRIEELVEIAGKSSKKDRYSVGQIRQGFAQRWNISADTPAFLRKAGGEAIEVSDDTIVEPGDELEFRAKDGEKGGGLLSATYAKVRELAKTLGAGGNGKKRDLALKVVADTLPELADEHGDVVLPMDESQAATVIVLQALYQDVRHEHESAHKRSLVELLAEYGEDARIERGKVVTYTTEPTGKTSFISRSIATRYVGAYVSEILAEISGEALHVSADSDPLGAGGTLTIVLA